MTDDVRKKQYFPSKYRIKWIQEGWKSKTKVSRSLNESFTALEDKKVPPSLKMLKRFLT